MLRGLSGRRGGGATAPAVSATAGTIPLAAGKVELPWRALLPPGVDDLVLAIHDDEPTSIIAYFLATRYAAHEQLPACLLAVRNDSNISERSWPCCDY